MFLRLNHSLLMTQREPHLPSKRASFLKRWEKWLFLLEKVCYVVIPRYLCIRRRTGSGHSRVRLPRVPYLSMTLLWLGRVSKLPLLSLCATVALPSLWVRSAFASGGEEKRETGGRQKQGKNRPPLTNPTKDRAVGGKNKSVWLF